MKYIILLSLLICGCKSSREYSTQCNFTVPVNKPLDASTVTVEVKVKGNY